MGDREASKGSHPGLGSKEEQRAEGKYLAISSQPPWPLLLGAVGSLRSLPLGCSLALLWTAAGQLVGRLECLGGDLLGVAPSVRAGVGSSTSPSSSRQGVVLKCAPCLAEP